jgi:pimeloyl-ACP methyl ester carboxylesterase
MKTTTPRAGQPKPPKLFWIIFLGLLGTCCDRANGSVTNVNISLQSQGDTYLIAGIDNSYFAGPTFDTNYAQTWQGATNCADISFSEDLSETVATNWSPASIGDDPGDGRTYASGSVGGALNAQLTTQLSPSGTLTISTSLSLNPIVAANSEGPGVGYWDPWSSSDTSGGLNCNIISDGTNPTPYQLQYTVSTSQTQSMSGNYTTLTQSAQIGFYTNNIALNGSASGKVIGFFGNNNDFVVSGDAAADVIWANGDAEANLVLTVVLTLGPPTGDLIFHAFQAEALNFSPSDGIDDPLIPLADPTVLTEQPIITGGLVADGVTPLLVELNFGASLPTTHSYTITLATPVGGTALIQIATLSGTGWQDGNSLSVAAGMSNAFFYVKPVKCEDLQLSGGQELTVGLSVQDTSAPGDITATNTLHLRKPPIALIHGYNSDPSAWSTSFTSLLTASRPQEFVIAVGYGTDNNNEFNTSGRLDDLAGALDTALQDQVEQPLKTNWAFTRYDVVGHSQGGVLARMLCQNLYPFTSTPIVSEDNFFRGRFRRVITIGAPHNGSVLLHYALQMKTNNPDPTVQWLVGCLGNLLQDKFDPFGLQIAEINNLAYPVDPRIKFFCLATAIYGGNPPDQITPCRAYWALGLRFPAPDYLQTRGQVLLPEGSDGIVDYESQLGGAGTPSASIDIGRVDIAHADEPDLFATAPGMSQTKAPDVASVVIARLDGPASAFGAFMLPSQLPVTQRNAIDALVPTVTHADIVAPGPAPLSGKTFYYNITAPIGLPIGGTVNWYAQVYGTNGLSTNGLQLQISSNGVNASITVDDSVIGEVVIYAAYSTTNGTFVAGAPVPVVSHLPSTLLNIDLQPNAIGLSPGDSASTQVWGVYSNNLEVPLFLTNGQASYVSSDTNVATVDALGTISIQTLGATVVTASYEGYSANTFVSTTPPVVGDLSISTTQNGTMQIAVVSSPGTTNILEASTNLITWVPIATQISSNWLVTFLDNSASTYPVRFYRLIVAGHSPHLIGVTANYASPVPATTNLILAFQFDSTMNINVNPQVVLSNAALGAIQPVVPTEGFWGSVARLNDTYYTAPITLTSGMSGMIQVFISAAQDTVGNVLTLTNYYNFVLNAGGASVVGWGNNSAGQATAPLGLSNVVSVSAGQSWTLALKDDQTVVGWGSDNGGAISGISALTNVTAIAAGYVGSVSLALLGNGTLVAAGYMPSGWATMPPGLSNITAISVSDRLNLALNINGTVIAWGDDYYGQADVPPGLQNVVAIAAGSFHGLALRSDGTVTAWGGNYDGSGNYTGAATVPVGLSNVVAIAAGYDYSLALTANHSVIAWGGNAYGQSTVPPGLSNVVSIATSRSQYYQHNLALTSSGEIVAWGYGGFGLVPLPQGLTNVIGIAVGPQDSFAIVAPTP